VSETLIQTIVAHEIIEVALQGPPGPTDHLLLGNAGTRSHLELESDIAAKADTTAAVMDGDAAGGVLTGTYPNPTFLVDMATQAELTTSEDAHLAAFVHGAIDHANRSALDLVTGTNTGDQTDISGNAATVTTNANLTGDVTSVGNAATLPTVNSTVGAFGSATNIPVVTVTGKGLVTSVTTVAVSIPSGALDFTGDVTGTGTTGAPTALTIDANAVTNAKAAQMASKSYKGRTSALTGNVEDVAVATLKSDLLLVKADVGLGSVDNTTDLLKPVSTAAQTALDGKIDDAQVLTNVPINAVFTDTVYNSTAIDAAVALNTAKVGITVTQASDIVANNAKLTASTANVTTAGALMDSELANIAAVKATTGTFLTADQTKLDGIEALADVTDTANVTTAGALMDSELANIVAVKATTGTFLTADQTKLDGIEALADVTDTTNVVAAISAGTGVGISAGGVISVTAVALTTVQTASTQIAHLALTAQEGDVVVRSDENKSYVHNGGTAGTMADYTLLSTPTDSVLSVSGKTGVVTLVSSDVGLGNVDNTTDANKPVSTAQLTALDLKLDDSQATSFGLSLLDDTNAAAGRTTLGLGTLATQSGTFSGTTSGTNTGDVANTALTTGTLDQFAATTSLQLKGNISDETGNGALVFATSPTLVAPALGTPASGVATNLTGTATGLTAGTSNSLKSATTDVAVSAATAPTSGQVLTATSSTAATWETPDSGGAFSRLEYTATAAQTTFASTYDVGFVDVYLNGVKLVAVTDFAATTGTSIVLTAGATLNDTVSIIGYIGTLLISNVYTKLEVDNNTYTKAQVNTNNYNKTQALGLSIIFGA